MKYYLDTEFYERGPEHPILLISVGIVSEDGREFYVENADVDRTVLSPWLQANVVPSLTGPSLPRAEIGQAVLAFIGGDPKPQFWAYFADYDWVVFCQLYGSMTGLPATFPMFCLDLKQEMHFKGIAKPVIDVCGPAHNALADAKWNQMAHAAVESLPAPVERTAEEPGLPSGWRFDDADDAVCACMRIAFSDTADDAEMDTDMKRSCRVVIPTGLAIAILRRAGWTVTR